MKDGVYIRRYKKGKYYYVSIINNTDDPISFTTNNQL
jgi:hypothetical protein